MTGHLVLSTIHTNDAASAITRMIDLGIPSFLIQATVVGIVAQRLVRKVCEKCAESYAVGAEELHRMGLAVAQKPMAEVILRRGKGCQRCRGTGYFGRTAVHEVIPYTDAIRRLTTPEADAHAIAAEAVREGMVSMRESAIQKMLAGVTTVEEVLRVTWEKV
jgi:general secretion pathway protein E